MDIDERLAMQHVTSKHSDSSEPSLTSHSLLNDSDDVNPAYVRRTSLIGHIQRAQHVKAELSTIRRNYLNKINPMTSSPAFVAAKRHTTQSESCQSPVYKLLQSASEKLRTHTRAKHRLYCDTELTPTQNTYHCDASPLGTRATSSRQQRQSAVSPLATPVTSSRQQRRSVDVKSISSKRKHFFTSPMLHKMPRMCFDGGAESSANEESFVTSTNKHQSRRRSSFYKLLSSAKKSKTKPPVQTRAHVDDVTVSRRRQPRNYAGVTYVSSPYPASRRKPHVLPQPRQCGNTANNDTVNTAELSSAVYSDTPTSTMLSSPTSTTSDCHARCVATEIRRLTGEMLNTSDKSSSDDRLQETPSVQITSSSACCSVNNTNSALNPLTSSSASACSSVNDTNSALNPLEVNQFNASELLSDSSGGESKVVGDIATVLSNSIRNAGKVDDVSPPVCDVSTHELSNLSSIFPDHGIDITLRAQASVLDVTSDKVFHSTFSFPLHSSMYEPLDCTLDLNSDNVTSRGSSTTSSSVAELNLAANRSTTCDSDDSSCLSIDVDDTLTDAQVTCHEHVSGTCDVCKLTRIRREIGALVDSKYRQTPVGHSRLRLHWNSKLPHDRPEPVGASQSFIDANTTTEASDTDEIDHLSEEISVTSSSTSYSSARSTQKECVETKHKERKHCKSKHSERKHCEKKHGERKRSERKHRRYDVYSSSSSTSTKVPSTKKTKRHRTALDSDILDKENDPALLLNRTPDVSVLKRRFKAYSSSDSGQYNMLAIL